MPHSNLPFSIIVPTYNAGTLWQKWIEAYKAQSVKAESVIIVDSSSIDNTVSSALQAGFIVEKIAKPMFNHGGTRNLATHFCPNNTEILVFLTQDALLASHDALENLLKPFDDPNVAAVYGRQLPHKDANPLATHARFFNYPDTSIIKSLKDAEKLGIKTAFISNSFAAYRRSIFNELNGFPSNTILAEDMHLAARMILNGYKIAYCAEAQVYHSHNYTLCDEFQRYFDTGVFQTTENWIQQNFGKASNEGKKFILSEISFLLKKYPFHIINSFLYTLVKFIGFKIGLKHKYLPINLKKKISMHKSYWSNYENKNGK